MDRFDYVKVLLYAYPQLKELADAASSGAEVKAYLSFRCERDALSLAEEIAGDIVLSKKLSFLKKKLDWVVGGCTRRERYLLEYKYFRRKRILRGEFADFSLGLCERSYFRLQCDLLHDIRQRFLKAGLTRERFLRDFSSFKPFMRVLRAVSGGRERTVVYKRRNKQLALFQNSENSCGAGGDFLPRSTNSAITISAAAATQMMTICVPDSPSLSAAGAPPPSPLSISPEEACR